TSPPTPTPTTALHTLSLHDALPISLGQDVLEELASTVANLDTIAGSIDLDKPWANPEAKEWDSVSVSTWLQNNVNSTAVQKILRSEEHTSELQSLAYLVCRLLLEKK